jgi:hypothetical protein
MTTFKAFSCGHISYLGKMLVSQERSDPLDSVPRKLVNFANSRYED